MATLFVRLISVYTDVKAVSRSLRFMALNVLPVETDRKSVLMCGFQCTATILRYMVGARAIAQRWLVAVSG